MVLLVVDARHILSGRIPKLERMAKNKLAIVATKSDLMQKKPDNLQEQKGEIPLFYVSSKTKEGVKELLEWILQKARIWREGNLYGGRKSQKKCNFDILIMGLPNVGKSSLINAMVGRKVARTGFRAGITRGVQWINLAEGIRLVDAPGVVEFAMKEEELALAGSLDVEKLKDPISVAEKLIENLDSEKKEEFSKYFGIEFSDDAQEVLARIASRRGKLMRKGVPNILEAAKIVLREYQKGKYWA
jgi:ribosome biogenesis GTPase A